jgi:hypothetical protein
VQGIPIEEQYQAIGLGVLIGVGAILAGYLVKMVVPKKHFPWTAAVLATNAVVAVFAYWGVKIAGIMLPGWLTVSMFAAAFAFRVDLYIKEPY